MAGLTTIRWGILGTAVIADKVGKAIQDAPGSLLQAVASRDLSKANAWAAERKIDRAYGSYAELLADPDIDAVYVPLPTSLHRHWTLEAAKAGKHILCEKPLAMNADEVREMTAACNSAGVQLMDGTFWVHHPRAHLMRKCMAAGELGELRRVTAAFSFCWPEIPRDNIRTKPELGGGSLGDLGWYCVRASLWAFGAMPERVFATARYQLGVDFNLSAILWFPGDRMASFDCGFDTVLRQWIEIAGTNNSLVCDDFVLARSQDKARFWIHNEEGVSRQIDSPPCVQQIQMIVNFNEIVRSRELADRWPAESLATMRVLDALAKAARTESVIKVD